MMRRLEMRAPAGRAECGEEETLQFQGLWNAHRLVAVAMACSAAAIACSKSDTPGPVRMGVNPTATGQSSAGAGSAPATDAASAALPARTTSSPDVDVAALQKKLHCGGATHKDACRVLDEFANGHPWQVRIPSGEGRWVGNAFNVEAGKDKADVLILSVRDVPTNSIAPGDLPIRVGTSPVPQDMRAAASKMVNAFARDDTVAKGNPALAFVRTWTSNREYSAVPTTGDSMRLVAEHETYLRQGKGQKVIMIQPHVNPSSASIADGMFAELWPASW